MRARARAAVRTDYCIAIIFYFSLFFFVTFDGEQSSSLGSQRSSSVVIFLSIPCNP